VQPSPLGVSSNLPLPQVKFWKKSVLVILQGKISSELALANFRGCVRDAVPSLRSIYTCLYIHVCLYLFIHIYIHIFIHMYICVYAYMEKNIHIYKYVCVHLCVYLPPGVPIQFAFRGPYAICVPPR